MIRVQCPSCGAGLRGPDEAAGKKIKCPKCGAIVGLPAKTAGDEASSGADLPPAGAFDLDEPMPSRTPAADADDDFVAKPIKVKAKGKKRSSPEDADLSTGEWVLAILCSGIGCIVGIVWMIQGKPKGKKMFGISILMVVVWNIVSYALRSSLNQKP
jgi:hypothetical protein